MPKINKQSRKNKTILNNINKNNSKNKSNNSNKNNNKKKYTLLNFPKEGINFGIFKSASPKRAAQKAFGKLAKKVDLTNNSGNFIVFTIKNLDTKKEYKYIGTRVKLAKPITVKRNNKTITYKFFHTVGKYKSELNKM